jgi:flagellar hook-associated protein 3 FlgL
MAVFPVPSNRSSDLLVHARMLAHLQGHQTSLLHVQDRMATGRKLLLPSDDSSAASRAMHLQMVLENKKQIAANLRSTHSQLAAADNSLANVSGSLIEIHSLALTTTNSTIPDVERTAAAAQIRNTIEQLIRVGNQEFQGRFLFAGSRTQRAPFELAGANVAFRGNTKSLQTFVDVGLLSEGSMSADAVFGVFSPGVLGDSDLNPILTESTPLADLRGGEGITKGSFSISDGSTSSIINISSAVTVGDVVRLIEAGAPGGRELVARVTSQGLSLTLEDTGLGGNLTVREIGTGTTAAQLGIVETGGVGTGPLIGKDLNPRMRPNTPLSDVLGVRAEAVLKSAGSHNDLIVRAVQRGPGFNGYHVQLVNDQLLQAAPGIAPDSEFATFSATPVAARAALKLSGLNNNLLLTANATGTDLNQVSIELYNAGSIGNNAVVSYDAGTKKVSIGIDAADQTQVQTVIAEINANTPFTATYDGSLAGDGGYVPTAAVLAADVGVVTGNTGNSGGAANTIFIHVASSSTALGVKAAVENSADVSALITAEIDAKDTEVADSAGLGTIASTAAATLSGGSGIEFDQSSGLQITNGGETYVIDISSAKTVEELLNVLNGSPANLLAEINETGTGINVRSILSGSAMAIGENGGQTAAQLGLRSFRETTQLADLNFGRGVETTDGVDFTIRRNDGVELDIDLTGAVTIADVLDRINNHAANTDPATRVEARLTAYGNGIELVDAAAGTESLTVTKRRSSAAIDLGLIPLGSVSASSNSAPVAATARLSFPAPNDINTALVITADVAGTTLNDVQIQFINSGLVTGDNATASYDSGSKTLTLDIDPTATTANAIVAALAADPNFSATLDTTSDPTNNGSGVVGFLGLAGTTSGGEAEILRADDVNLQEVHGVFNTLVKLANAVEFFDVAQIERLTKSLGDDLDRLLFARAELGARGQFLDAVQVRVEDESIELQKGLSDEVDADLVETISELTRRQAALQATLQLIGRSFRLSLLDFL